ncbi:MAG: transglycosylase SLT domain-containing protein [Paracoccaceae bacterium]
MKHINKLFLLSFITVLLVSCGVGNSSKKSADGMQPVMRWDHRQESAVWTKATLDALDTHGAALLNIVPGDIEEYCPAYPKASRDDKAAFWSGLLSALAKHESTWNPKASGGGGQWIGLTQISPATARHYGCKATSVAALKNGADNLSCSIRIIAVTVPRDGVVSHGRRGVAADWAPFLNAKKEADMMAWTRSQSYCVK